MIFKRSVQTTVQTLKGVAWEITFVVLYLGVLVVILEVMILVPR